VMGDQEIAAPQKAQHRAPAHRKYVLAPQGAPDVAQFFHALERGVAGIEGPVQGADAGADHHVRGDAVSGKRMQHADLNGAKTAAAREHKGGLRLADLIAYRQTPGSLIAAS